MINFSLMGAGRIGKMHAEIIHNHPECNLKFIYDVNKDFAKDLANKYESTVTNSPEEAINNSEIDSVFIAYCYTYTY